jgi:xylulokinase
LARRCWPAVGAGVWPDVESACRRTIQVTGATQPQPDAVAAYNRSYEIYRGLYPALKSSFARLAE